jgi:hypothetical protein
MMHMDSSRAREEAALINCRDEARGTWLTGRMWDMGCDAAIATTGDSGCGGEA